MINLKKQIREGFTFCCMIVVLGIQTLLHGRWKVQEPKSIRSKHKSLN